MKIVLVEWDDAAMEGHWIDGHPAKPKPQIVRSIGFLAHKTKKHILLVQSVAENCHGNSLQIPRRMVRKMVEM